MLYRLCPPSSVTWCDLPDTVQLIQAHPDADFEKLPWEPAEARAFSDDLLRIATRHGVPSSAGIILDVQHTLALGRADELRINQIAAEQAHADLPESYSMQLVEQMFSEGMESDAHLNEEIRKTTEKVARKAEKDLAEVLAAPVQPELVEHWRRIGGRYPD
ncbi:MAG: hypothetical protein JWQ81_2651 [Amycolatopsis sp.]|uniref:hypothetical protein n=1 Tax=Amycolatopsis sp. TaxID=37632 RepID=UPI002638870C|nr:hypothetical protein [Amycolatopsis sp.]MCU1681912.1 hypothetical protein [Amycolatopsis sp.]